jgi:hypothetical protein
MTASNILLFLTCLLGVCVGTIGTDKAARLYRYVRLLERDLRSKRWLLRQQRLRIAQLESQNALQARALAKKRATGLYLPRGQAG